MMQELGTLEDVNGEGEKLVIRRAFIPVELYINQPGAFKTFRVKLSPKIRKVRGVLATADPTAILQPVPVWHAGSGVSPDPVPGDFIIGLPNKGFMSEESYQFSFLVEKDQWGYYAQPERTTDYTVASTGKGAIPIEVIDTVQVVDPATGFIEPYQVWRTVQPGSFTLQITVTYTQPV